MPARKWTIEKVKSEVEKIHAGIISIDESTFNGMDKKCRFIDKDYGEWWTKPSKIIHRGQGHKKRGSSKAKKTFLLKYGVDSPLKNKDIMEKVKNTCLEKYGVDNPSKNIKVRDKISKSFSEKTTEEVQETVEKRRVTCLERYGVDNPLKSKDIKERATKSLVANYGVTVPAKNDEILKKMKSTCLKKYGVDNPSKHPDVIKKIERTMRKKYGVKSSMQNADVASKNAKAQTRAIELVHWKTGEEIVCVGSYEVKTVEYFNKNKINFKWQSKTFVMPDGRTYRPDCYLFSTRKWIEIKGYFRKDAEEKWNWFHNEKTNSELWNKEKLKNLGIL